MGFRNIGTIKKDFDNEFKELSKLRESLESKINEFNFEKEKLKDDYLEIIKINKEQDNRIKVLELLEKISKLYNEKRYPLALDYTIAALELSPQNITLKKLKALCYWKLSNYNEAIEVYKDNLENDPNDMSSLVNLSELLLINDRNDDFRKLYEKNKYKIDNYENGIITSYFLLIESFNENNHIKMKEIILNSIDMLVEQKSGWDFYDILDIINKKDDSKGKSIITLFIKIVKNEINKEDALNKLNSIFVEY